MAGKTLVLGASTSPHRYSFVATHQLLKKGHQVVLVGKSGGEVAGNVILTIWPTGEEIDTITMYLAPHNQLKYYGNILESGASRVIFNPGTENDELENLTRAIGMEVEEACTLVLLSTNQY